MAELEFGLRDDVTTKAGNTSGENIREKVDEALARSDIRRTRSCPDVGCRRIVEVKINLPDLIRSLGSTEWSRVSRRIGDCDSGVEPGGKRCVREQEVAIATNYLRIGLMRIVYWIVSRNIIGLTVAGTEDGRVRRSGQR